jgi:ubiquinone/menaquinone biosynthesis C-methylase UbiE
MRDFLAKMVSAYKGRFDMRHKFFNLLIPSASVLDVGSGEGEWIKALLRYRPGLDFTAVDKQDFSGIMKFTKFHRADLTSEHLPFKDQAFDGALVMHLIEHLANPHFVLSECYRVLKKGGLVYLETPSVRSIFFPSYNIKKFNSRCDKEGPYNFYDDPTHLRPYTKYALCRLLREAGFEVLDVGIPRNLMMMLLTPFYLLFGLLTGRRIYITYALSNFFGWSLFAIARKG